MMAAAKNRNAQAEQELRAFADALKAGAPDRLYFFFGEEHYLMERYLEQLRDVLIPEGTGAFNHHRLEGRAVTAAAISDAVDLLPVFSERTLIEIWDYDPFKAPEEDRGILQALAADLPEYVCLVFVFDTIPYAPDRRLKLYKPLMAAGHAVEFMLQDEDKLVRWIRRHVQEEGKSISPADARYLSEITGGRMTALHTEIAKLCSYASGPAVTRADIDVCVTPSVEAAVYRLADAMIAGDYRRSSSLLNDILELHEPVQKVLYALHQTMKNVLYARLALDAGKNAEWLEQTFHFARSFQASNAISAARRLTLDRCRGMVLLCADAALQANSFGRSDSELLSGLLIDLCYGKKADLL